jgi:hypothetical protein
MRPHTLQHTHNLSSHKFRWGHIGVKKFWSDIITFLSLTKAEERKITTCEMRCLRRAAGRTRRDMIRNEKIREMVGATPVHTHIQRQRTKWFGHLIRIGHPTSQLSEPTTSKAQVSGQEDDHASAGLKVWQRPLTTLAWPSQRRPTKPLTAVSTSPPHPRVHVEDKVSKYVSIVTFFKFHFIYLFTL